jgi:uncharacterized membrane protein YkvA (DUF1232 family)
MATRGRRTVDLGDVPVSARYYDSLRLNLSEWLRERTGPRYDPIRQLLLLVPDVFALVFRLVRDPRVSLTNRLKLLGLMIYIVSPIDLNLDFILPFGPLDDLALALVVLDSVLRQTPDHVLEDNWPGDEDALDKLRGLTGLLWAIKKPPSRPRRRAPRY